MYAQCLPQLGHSVSAVSVSELISRWVSNAAASMPAKGRVEATVEPKRGLKKVACLLGEDPAATINTRRGGGARVTCSHSSGSGSLASAEQTKRGSGLGGGGGAREGCRGHVLARRGGTFELGWAEARKPCSVNKPCGGAPRLPCPSVMLSSQALRRACLAAHWNRGGQSVALPPRPSRFCVGKQEEQESCAKNSTETWPPGGFCGRGERGPFPLVLCNAWLSGG